MEYIIKVFVTNVTLYVVCIWNFLLLTAME